MVNWSDPTIVAESADAWQKIIFIFFGMQLWELLMTFGFEWSLLTGRRKFRWPLSNFLSAPFWRRLTSSLSQFSSSSPDTACCSRSLECTIIAISVRHPINCGSLFTFNSWSGNMSILCASTSLMLRTIALWERKRSVVIPLVFLALTHWVLLYRTMFIVKAVWEPNLNTCVVVSTSPSLLNVTFFFTMAFDFVILVFTAVALMARHSARTDLWRLLFTDGLSYFLISFTMNCIPAVLNLLNLNSPMNVVATDPAAAISSMAACRAVMRLLDFNSDVHVHSLSKAMPSSDMPFPRFALRQEGVLVTTEQITMKEFPSPPPTSYGKTDLHRYDVEAGRRGIDIDGDCHSDNGVDDAFESSEYTATH
ncbi:hypothetical protein MSAN_01430100 [Mycena sanguinolenta]|uniref:Uncharacterized protein n=1 Tax=Mycena sanguinolenta TaxID=230812 RepID=A0A8H6YB67_9AGAR|nr:hypothetical protein MSAN_01430100 [Mycena sanguinolenta]